MLIERKENKIRSVNRTIRVKIGKKWKLGRFQFTKHIPNYYRCDMCLDNSTEFNKFIENLKRE